MIDNDPLYGLTLTKRVVIDERYDAWRDQYGNVIVFDKRDKVEWCRGERIKG